MILVAALTVLVLLAALVGVTSAVRHDGYGTRPAPSSHLDWDAGTLPSTPPVSLRR